MEDFPLEMLDMILLKTVRRMMVIHSSEEFSSFDKLMYHVLNHLRTISSLWNSRLYATKWVKIQLQRLRNTSKERDNETKENILDCYAIFVKDVDISAMRVSLIDFKVLKREKMDDLCNKSSNNRSLCRAFLDHLFIEGHPLAFLAMQQLLNGNKDDILDYMDGRKTCTMTEEGSKFLSNDAIKEIVLRGYIYDQLIADMDPDRLGDWLKQERIITIEEWQESISSSVNIKDRCHSTLDYLSTISHPRAYITLRQVLIQDYPKIASAIDNATSEAGTQKNISNEIRRENEKIKDQVISIYTDFVSGVDPMNVFDLLIKNRIVSLKQKKKVMKEITAKERCRALIDHLFLCSKENAFIVLKEALKGHYPKIVEYLDAFDSDDENEDDYSTSKLENERIRNKIVAIYSDFVSDVDSLSVFDNLIENKIVNIKQKQLIVKKSANKEERCRALLDHLLFCSKEKAFIILREALKEHYPVIVERIDTCDTDKQIEFSTRFESCIIVAGFDNDEAVGQDVVKIKLNGTNEVYNIEPLPPHMNRESAAAVYDNSLFVTGVGKNCDKIWKMDARSSKWEYCNTMIRGRRKHSVAFVDHVLYICGGWVDDGEITLDDVEVYDTIDDRCTTVGKLVHAVRNAGNCVPFKSLLYIFGGQDAKDEAVDYVQVYDTKLNSCNLLSKRMPVAYYLLRAVLWENKAILLGYFKCLVYNFDTETWQMRDQFKADVGHFGMIVHNGKLFVIGGGRYRKDDDGNEKWTFRDDVRSVPVENVLNDESIAWLHHAKLPKPATAFSYGKMEFLVQKIEK